MPRICMQVDSVSSALASAHMPLVLLCAGLWLREPRPKGVLVRAPFHMHPNLASVALCQPVDIGLTVSNIYLCTKGHEGAWHDQQTSASLSGLVPNARHEKLIQ